MKNIAVSALIAGLFAPFCTQAQTTVQTQIDEPATATVQTMEAPKPTSRDTPKIFYGGGIGLGFGDVDYFEIWPLIGVNLSRPLAVGLQFIYRQRKDNRYPESLKTEDYGATLFGRYRLPGPLYLQAEYEYLDYEYRTSYYGTETKRSNFSSFMAGGGVSQMVGGNTSLYATVLYNFSYDQPDSPYDNPWIVRFGVGVGF